MHRIAVILDLNSGVQEFIRAEQAFHDHTIVERAPCRPFGITWNANELFIANNRQLLVYDKTLSFVRLHIDELQVNTHQIAYDNGLIWAASPFTNSIIGVPIELDEPLLEFFPMKQLCRPYVLRHGSPDDDLYHINSLLWTKDSLYVLAHNLGRPSFLLEYHRSLSLLQSAKYDFGICAHGLAISDGIVFTIDTAGGVVVSTTGYCSPRLRTGFARGFAMTDQYFIVGVSERRSRSDRSAVDAWIQVIEIASNSFVGEFHLKGVGSINDLRILDTYDKAHAVTSFWPATEPLKAACSFFSQ